MGINPCPLSSPTIPNGGQQLGINQGSPNGGQQMESTHIHTQWRMTNGNQPMSTKLTY